MLQVEQQLNLEHALQSQQTATYCNGAEHIAAMEMQSEGI